MLTAARPNAAMRHADLRDSMLLLPSEQIEPIYVEGRAHTQSS